MQTIDHLTRRRRFFTLFALLALTMTGHPATAEPPPLPSEPETSTTADQSRIVEWLDSMERYYDAHPELKTTPGSGWKPYNRVKWFREQRRFDGRYPTGGDLWRAWEAKQDRLRELGPAFRSTSPWFTLGPTNFSGRMVGLAFHPTDGNVIYAAAAGGGLWKSTDHGLTWSPKTDEIPSLWIGAVAVLPWNEDVVLLGTGYQNLKEGVGILKSTDAGETWSTTGFIRSVTADHGIYVIGVNPTTQTILVGATDGLWRSTDEGDTWTLIRSGTGGGYYKYFDVKWKPGDPNRVYCVGWTPAGHNIKVSTDDGLTWSKAGTGQPASALIKRSILAVAPTQPDWIYAHLSNGFDTIGVYRSTDDGATWVLRNSSANIAGGQGYHDLCLVVDPDDENRVFGAGVNLWRSTDGALTFSIPTANSSVHNDHNYMLYEPGLNNSLWLATDGGLYESTNSGISYTGRNAGLVTYQIYDVCLNNHPGRPYYAMGGTQDQGTDKWSGTTTWSQGAGGDGMVCMIDPGNGTTVFAERQYGANLRNTTSGTGSWTSISGYSGNKDWVNAWAEDQTDGSHLYTQSSQGIFRSTDSGTSWDSVATHTAAWIDFHDLDGSRIWTVGDAAVDGGWVTTDDGATWTQTPAFFGLPSPLGSPTKVLAHPVDLNTAFVTFSGYDTVHVAVTTDLGATWTDVTGDLPPQPVNAIAVDPLKDAGAAYHDWYIGTDTGVWLSTDGGTTWLPADTSLPNARVTDLEIAVHQRKLVAGTYGRGMWEMDLPAPTAVGEPAVALSRKLMLDPPSPNPVSDRTMLRWAARHDGPVTLEIFDVRGRRVMELEELPRGDGIIRTTPWFPDGRPAGVYFAVVRAGEERLSRKVVVTR